MPKVKEYSVQQLINYQAYLKRVMHKDIKKLPETFRLRPGATVF